VALYSLTNGKTPLVPPPQPYALGTPTLALFPGVVPDSMLGPYGSVQRQEQEVRLMHTFVTLHPDVHALTPPPDSGHVKAVWQVQFKDGARADTVRQCLADKGEVVLEMEGVGEVRVLCRVQPGRAPPGSRAIIARRLPPEYRRRGVMQLILREAGYTDVKLLSETGGALKLGDSVNAHVSRGDVVVAVVMPPPDDPALRHLPSCFGGGDMGPRVDLQVTTPPESSMPLPQELRSIIAQLTASRMGAWTREPQAGPPPLNAHHFPPMGAQAQQQQRPMQQQRTQQHAQPAARTPPSTPGGAATTADPPRVTGQKRPSLTPAVSCRDAPMEVDTPAPQVDTNMAQARGPSPPPAPMDPCDDPRGEACMLWLEDNPRAEGLAREAKQRILAIAAGSTAWKQWKGESHNPPKPMRTVLHRALKGIAAAAQASGTVPALAPAALAAASAVPAPAPAPPAHAPAGSAVAPPAPAPPGQPGTIPEPAPAVHARASCTPPPHAPAPSPALPVAPTPTAAAVRTPAPTEHCTVPRALTTPDAPACNRFGRRLTPAQGLWAPVRADPRPRGATKKINSKKKKNAKQRHRQ
jgi:hypothetical protein